MGSETKSVPSQPLTDKEITRHDFPKDFVFGCATAAYQVEGFHTHGGRSLSIWDVYSNGCPGNVRDGSNGNAAVGMYATYKDDIKTMKMMGFDAYRFSISWSRILPGGKLCLGVNQEGVDYYNDLIDTVIANGMKPYVTIFHWDLPYVLEKEYGGFLSHNIVDDFRDFAELCFWKFGDRVKHWITINEAWTYAVHGYANRFFPPGHGYFGPQIKDKGNTSCGGHDACTKITNDARTKMTTGSQLGIHEMGMPLTADEGQNFIPYRGARVVKETTIVDDNKKPFVLRKLMSAITSPDHAKMVADDTSSTDDNKHFLLRKLMSTITSSDHAKMAADDTSSTEKAKEEWNLLRHNSITGMANEKWNLLHRKKAKEECNLFNTEKAKHVYEMAKELWDLFNHTKAKEAYTVARNLLLSHAAAVDSYRKKFQKHQHGKIGMTNNIHWFEPYDKDVEEDRLAARRAHDFMLGWFLEPVLTGQYPKNMLVFARRHITPFTEEESKLLKGSVDFLGINYYTAWYATNDPNPKAEEGYNKDQQVKFKYVGKDGKPIGESTGSSWLYIVPWGLYKLLNFIHVTYKTSNCKDLPPIFITENGCDQQNDPKQPTYQACKDTQRVNYFKDHLAYLHKAMTENNIKVESYFAWSFCDNFEWYDGYNSRFGILYIDFKNDLKRYRKDSAVWFSRFLLVKNS